MLKTTYVCRDGKLIKKPRPPGVPPVLPLAMSESYAEFLERLKHWKDELDAAMASGEGGTHNLSTERLP